MKLKLHIYSAAVFFILTAITAVLSWIGSVYAWNGVNNMLSGEGLRWFLHTVTSRYLSAPFLGEMIFAAFAIGLFTHSRLLKLCTDSLTRTRNPSRKERRAVTVAAVYALLYMLLISLLAFGPSEIVRSITGSLKGSALAHGAWFLISFGIGSTAVVYAYAVDFYESHLDIVRGMTHGISLFAPYFVTLFFVCQLFTILSHSGLTVCAGVRDEWINIAYYFSCLIPLAECLSKQKSKT